MRVYSYLIAAMAFVIAAALALFTALFTAGAIETRAERAIKRLLDENGMAWAQATADGLLVQLTGTAPSEAARFRAVSLAGRVVSGGRVRDELEVKPTNDMTAPRFSVELLRNDDGISVIGLVPSSWDYGPKMDTVQALVTDGEIVDMLETADFAIPDGWVEAVDFGLRALRLLPRSKISVSADTVVVNAISDSTSEKQRFEAELSQDQPEGLDVSISISAPRPVIAPFILRYVIDEDGKRFDACSADTPRAQARILAAAQAGGMTATARCTLGLGAPSPRWSDASVAAIRALGELGAGVVTISDVDVTLIASETVSQDDFDRVVGELTSNLPEVFSLKATLATRKEAGAEEQAAQFNATLSPEGQVQLRGRLMDERMRQSVEAFAKARFGADAVYTATRLDENVPMNWGVRVLAGLGALSELGNGSLVVMEDRLTVRGVTGRADARQDISRLLSEHLGQGASFTVDVRYDERLDPTLGLPSAEDCVRIANESLARGKITFDPGVAEISVDARRSLVDLADALENCGDHPIEIGGHTDSQGRSETNLALSQQRAETVLRELAVLGAPVQAMIARGYGQAEPVADNTTEEGREANRRIAFKLIEAATSETPDLVDTEGETDRAPDAVAVRTDDQEKPEAPDDAIPQDVETPDTRGIDETADAAIADDIDNAELDWQDTSDTANLRPRQRPETR